MAGIDPFASITAATLDLLTRDGDLFLTLGTNLFRGLAVILIAWFGIRAALTSTEGGSPLPLGSFVSLLLTIAFGLVATGVAVLVGPVFIPFFLVPQLDWLFWGWLKSLLQYAFYQVIAQAFVFVFGTFLINFLDAFPPPYTVDRLLVGGFHLISLLLAFTYGLLKVPSLTHSLFSGGSGESALPRVLG